jgi:hypothetical protein
MSTGIKSGKARSRKELIDWVTHQKGRALSGTQTDALDGVYPSWRYTLEESWFLKFEAVREIFERTGHLPRPASANAEEKVLGTWLSGQRGRAAELSEDKQARLDGLTPAWRELRYKSWDERLEQACRVTASLGRTPAPFDSEGDANEAIIWLRNQRRLAADNPRSVILDERIPGWRLTNVDKWMGKLKETKAFSEQKDRLPNRRSNDPAEKALGTWLHHCKRKESTLPSERLRLLDEHLPGWRITKEMTWRHNLDAVVEFHLVHGRFPRGKAEDLDETILGRWVQNQRAAEDTLPGDRIALLDGLLPGWRTLVSNDHWAHKFEQCIQFTKANGRMPSQGKDSPRDEIVLAQWIIAQRKYKKVQRLELLDQHLPGWRGARRDTGS